MAECATRLGVTPRTIRNYISRGFFPAYRIPGTRGVRVLPHEVEAAMEMIPASRARAGVAQFGPAAKIVTLTSVGGE